MRISNGEMKFSPTDLVRFFESEFASYMDHYEKTTPSEKLRAEGVHRDPKDPLYELIADLGNKHEEDVIAEISKKAKIVIIDKANKTPDQCLQDTLKAMQEGADLIYQGALGDDLFFGYADLLVKKEGKSKFGPYYYEPEDIKIASHPKPNAIIQLCCYSDLLLKIQGTLPGTVSVITKDGKRHNFNTTKFFSYYTYLKEVFLTYHKECDPTKMPIPEKTADHKDWTTFGKKQLHLRDDISLTARIRSNHIDILREEKVLTLSELSKLKPRQISGIPLSTFEILIDQAKLQFHSRGKEKPEFKVLSHTGKREGLELLPPPDAHDIFFDMEGYPLLGRNGLEYLFGNFYGKKYQAFWAHRKDEEGQAFAEWIKWAFEIWQKNPWMHIYHYGHYEPSTIKRLMGQYGLCEFEVDTLLRNQVFVDLHRIVTQGLRVGGHSYSLKIIEKLYYPDRKTTVQSGADAAVRFFHFMNSGEQPEQSKFLQEIQDYNCDDCKSTQDLYFFLLRLQKENKIAFMPLQSEEAEVKERKPPAGDCEKKAKSLLQNVPPEKRNLPLKDTTEVLYLTELLAHLLEFHIREDKPGWWDYFSRFEMALQEKYEEPYTIADCRIESITADGWKVRFEIEQEIRLDEEDEVLILEEESLSNAYTILSIDYITGCLILKPGKNASTPKSAFTLIPKKGDFFKQNIYKSLLKTANAFSASAKSFGLRKCLVDLLLRKKPDLKGHSGKLISSADSLVTETCSHALNMNETVLCIQGPPGTGKTYTAAHVILHLVKNGKRVGVTANSHSAICNLLKKITNEKDSTKFRIQKVVKTGAKEEEQKYFNGMNVDIVDAKSVSGQIVGATTFFFARQEQENSFDYLFVDEASQVCLANLVAAAQSTKNIILLGDQNQLDQPIQGSHPGESGKSALSYYIDGQVVIPEDQGIFLPITHRMHPKVCEFISENFYEGKLTSHPKTTIQRMKLSQKLSTILPESGVRLMPIDHLGNMHSSEEEVALVKDLYSELLQSSWVDHEGKVKKVTNNDILVVAPYNLQVARLKKTLGEDALVGTVDKFQGLEAPVTIVSMTSSTIKDAPRGISFLLSKNRLNVAISRAKCLSIVVGSSNIPTPHLTSLHSIELMNAWARLILQ